MNDKMFIRFKVEQALRKEMRYKYQKRCVHCRFSFSTFQKSETVCEQCLEEGKV